MKTELSLLYLWIAAPAAAAQSTLWIVNDDPQIGHFDDIQPAVDAATDGDQILVGSGVYSAFTIDGKSLHLCGDVEAPILVPGFELRGLIDGQSATVSGIEVEGGLVRIVDCAGSARIVSCAIRTRVEIVGSLDSYLSSCTVVPVSYTPDGASILIDATSRLALYECVVHGEFGSAGLPDGYRDGTTGIRVAGHVSGSRVWGGPGAVVYCWQTPPGDGGNGVEVLFGGEVQRRDSHFFAGQGGWTHQSFDCFEQGVSGNAIQLRPGAVLTEMEGPALRADWRALRKRPLAVHDPQLHGTAQRVCVRGLLSPCQQQHTPHPLQHADLGQRRPGRLAQRVHGRPRAPAPLRLPRAGLGRYAARHRQLQRRPAGRSRRRPERLLALHRPRLRRLGGAGFGRPSTT